MAKYQKIKNDGQPLPDSGIEVSKAPEHSDLPMKSADPKAKQKKAIIISFIVMCFIAVISYVIIFFLPDPTVAPPDPEKDNNIIGQYGSTHSYIFYPIDYDLDISTVKEYQELNRTLYYKVGPETMGIYPEDLDTCGDDIKFFYNYFQLIISGDYEEYGKLFTDRYYEDNPEYKDKTFTQQMIYDIIVETLGSYDYEGQKIYKYNISYRIFRNNGTFRNDIDSDVSKTLYFELIETDSGFLIDFIDYYV